MGGGLKPQITPIATNVKFPPTAVKQCEQHGVSTEVEILPRLLEAIIYCVDVIVCMVVVCIRVQNAFFVKVACSS